MAEWIDLISSKVITRIKSEFSTTLKKEYKMSGTSFSTIGSSDSPAQFPFVYVQLLPSVEMGQDLDGTEINAGLFTFQIDVTDNVSQLRARNVMAEVRRIMKGMRFNIKEFPNFEDTKDKHRATMRCSRVIGASDEL